MIRDWFRSKRTLRADLDRQRDLLTAKDDQIRDAAEGLNEYAAVMAERFADLRKGHLRVSRELRGEKDAHLETKRLLDAERARVAAIREELTQLRDDIRREEHDTRPPTAGGFGMARFAEVADFIRRDSIHKRLEDQ